jgi:hypothetical protein
MLAAFLILSATKWFIFNQKFEHIEMNYYLRLGIIAMAMPQATSNPPTTRRYHFEGNLNSSAPDSGNTLAYLT